MRSTCRRTAETPSKHLRDFDRTAGEAGGAEETYESRS
jgi:hypothetical protein